MWNGEYKELATIIEGLWSKIQEMGHPNFALDNRKIFVVFTAKYQKKKMEPEREGENK